MSSIDLKSLGFTQEELQQRVVDSIADQLMTDKVYDPDSEAEYPRHSAFRDEIKKRVKTRIDEKIDELAQKFVLPNVAEYIETLTLQETNKWGEKKGDAVTFIEYLVGRAQFYMQEEVNMDGKSKAQADGYSWSGKQTRITYLINNHLQYSIETAMKDALRVATGEVAKGIHETARHKLNEIAASLKVAVTTK
jgi:hypothetical protein